MQRQSQYEWNVWGQVDRMEGTLPHTVLGTDACLSPLYTEKINKFWEGLVYSEGLSAHTLVQFLLQAVIVAFRE